MCGIAGIMSLNGKLEIRRQVLERMAETLAHRGPDSSGFFTDDRIAMGFRRLKIIDLETGDQPIYNEDRTITLVCNGEIYNHLELRKELTAKGHRFYTKTDVEILVHLYEEEGVGLLDKLNGQFAFAIFDHKKQTLFMARDQFGINPIYYTVVGDEFIFGSEIKALLEHPKVVREVDLTGLDQILSFPGLVPPRTMFKGISCLPAGHFVMVRGDNIQVAEYWDLEYPRTGDISYRNEESYYVERLHELFERSVRYRLQADVPVGLYLSGGMDSSMVVAMARRLFPQNTHPTMSIAFNDSEISESKYQRKMASHLGTKHHEILFDWAGISERLPQMIYHCECPVKETFNTCSLALSGAAHKNGMKVILAGEGADELFAGYVGYRFDHAGLRQAHPHDLEAVLESELRAQLWGDENLFYEKDQYAYREIKRTLYSERLGEIFDKFDCTRSSPVNKERIAERHPIHQRSYIDFKLRLADHLLTEHGDRMTMANSIEGRYPFLDIDLVEFAKEIPPNLKLNKMTEKYILKRVARDLVPDEILNREKFGFRGPGSPYLLRQDIEWINDTLSYERVSSQGYFNPDVVERLKKQYTGKGFHLNAHLETDLLMFVLSFGIFLETFDLPRMGERRIPDNTWQEGHFRPENQTAPEPVETQ